MKNKVLHIIRTKFRSLCCRTRGRLLKYYPQITAGKRIYRESNVEMNVAYGGEIIIGDDCVFRSGCKILTYGGNVKIGHHCSVNPYTLLYGQGNLTIGNYVRIAAQCIFIPSNHQFSDTTIPIAKQPLSKKGITIEDDVWVGSGVQILDGVTIAQGCVIGAGSVVTKSTEPYGIYVGSPARLIKRRK